MGLSISNCTDFADEDRLTILSYLDAKGLIASDTSGVYVVTTQMGTADRPEEISTIELSYKGYYTDGIVFDQSPADQKASIKLSYAIKGLRYGLAKFGKNSAGVILIPSDLAYGKNPPFGIRKNAVLIYDVQVHDFK